MLPKEKRVTSGSFEAILKKGALFHSSFFTLRILPCFAEATQGKPKESKFSVVVSKKVAKTAVLRNKIRRRVYSCIREILKTSSTRKPGLLVFFAKKDVDKLKFINLKSEVENLLSKSGFMS
jgi:ribonuclease P protein component